MKKTSCLSATLLFGVTVCLLVGGQVVKADFIFGEPTKVPNLNSSSAEFSPSISADGPGKLEAASTFELGAPGTNYTTTFPGSGAAAPYGARGLERQGGGGGVWDGYALLNPYTLRVDMRVSEPGDWIRVITEGSIQVNIDIKPGSFPNSINPNSGGVIPVAILTTDDFDASTVDPATVALGGVLARGKGKSGKVGSLEDVDGDGDLDLVVQIVNEIDWAEDATDATLTGETFDGIPIEGTDSVRIVPPDPE